MSVTDLFESDTTPNAGHSESCALSCYWIDDNSVALVEMECTLTHDGMANEHARLEASLL